MSNLRCLQVFPTKMINLIYACGDKVSKGNAPKRLDCQVVAKKSLDKKWYTKNQKKKCGEMEKMEENTFVASRQGVNFLALT